MNNKPHLSISIFIATLFLTTVVFAQQDAPTPAPTKTPAATAIATASITQEAITQDSAFTQNDLEVITGNVQRPNGIVWFNNKLYVICSGDYTIYEIDATTGSTVTYIYGIRNGHSLYAEQAGDEPLTLWVPDFSTNQLMKVNASRSPEVIASDLDGPWGITALSESLFAVTSQNGNQVLMIDREGGMQVIADEMRSPTGIVSDAENIYVANSGSARRAIEWFEKSAVSSEAQTTVEPKPLISGLQNVTGLTLDDDGMLYFAFSLGTRGVVGRADVEQCIAQGGCTNDETEIILYTELAAPLAGLSISSERQLYIHTMFRPEIYRIQLN